MKNNTGLVAFAALIVFAGGARGFAQQAGAGSRVEQLLEQMTLDEKLAMIHGTGEDASTYQGQAGYLPGIKRLGIPAMRFADGPPGVLTRVPSIAPTATMGLAATFSREDAMLNGAVIGREARSHGVQVALQPFVNIARDFAFGRAYNTFGEDPFLSGEMAAAEIRGIQGEGVMAQVKHFIGYDTDGTEVAIDQQTLHEVYAAPFDAAVRAGVSSIMCSYNHINGPYACGNRDTLTKMLREEMGFKGFVTSDWGAVHATEFINAGTDVEMPGPLPVSWAGPSYFVNGPAAKRDAAETKEKPGAGPLTDAGLPEEPASKGWNSTPEPPPSTDLKRLVSEGKVSEATITEAARRVLVQMDRFGYLDGKAKLEVTPSDTTANARAIEKTAIDAAVLLKNDRGALPLRAGQLKDVVMIGPGANQTIAVGMAGEKAVGLPERMTGAVEALRSLSPGASVRYVPADDMEGVPIPAKLLTHDGAAGLEADGRGISSIAGVNYTIAAGTALPADTKAIWTGTLTVPESGRYRLHLQVLGCYATLTIDDQIVAKNGLMWIHGDVTQAAQDNVLPTLDGLDNLRAAMLLEAGVHRIRISIEPDGSHTPAQLRLNWVTPGEQAANYRAAVAAARSAKTAIVFAWSRGRPVFGLPGDQDKLIRDVAAANPNTIVVLNVSQPVAMPWLESVRAVLQMWWPGNEGGWATAKLLMGEASPAGRLPFTWERRIEDTPAGDPSHPERTAAGANGRTTFSEGVLVGYRWFDAKKIEPLFPFGYGLSYSSFRYSGLKLERAQDGGVDASVKVENLGGREADEVAQVYVEQPLERPAGADFAEAVLGGFERVKLAANESQVVRIHVPLRQLQFWSAGKQAWVTPAGERTLWVGGSSRDRRAEASIGGQAAAAGPPAYLNTTLPAAARAADLVARMTLEEKASQVVHQAAAIPRLNVPAYNWWTEALHGVATSRSTVFPEPIGLAASFDAPLIHEMGEAIGTEARAKHEDERRRGIFAGVGLNFWAPNINIFRDPRWGRGQETYGEDPYLTGRMGAAFVTGMQGDDPHYLRVVSTPKHYAVHSGPEPVRHTIDVKVSKHDEEDTYLPAFRMAMTEGKAGAVMCAYNRINGEPACANQFLLEDQLRGKWGFQGYVVSDCDAVFDIARGHHFAATQEEAAAISMKRGTDLDCNDPGNDSTPYVKAVKKGLLPEAVLDRSLVRLMTSRMELGMFDPPEQVRYAQTPLDEVESEAHRRLALKLAEESMVLLKNDGTLPLKRSVRKIAVVGPLADQAKVQYGNYNGTPSRSTSAIEGIRRAFPEAKVSFNAGTEFLRGGAEAIPGSWLSTEDGRQGLRGEYFKGIDLAGSAVLTRVDPAIDFENWTPVDELGNQNFSVRWTGYITAPKTGSYEIGMSGDDGYRMSLDGAPFVADWGNHGTTTKTKTIELEAGKKYAVKLEYFQGGGGSAARLVFMPHRDGSKLRGEAVAAAKEADVVVAVVGITSSLEGEEMQVDVPGFAGGDRTSLDLPAPEQELLEAIKATGKPLVVVLMNGSALSVNWADKNASAMIDAWYSGEEGGTAIGKTLSGGNNPAGRLPVTFYASVDQLPPFDDYSMKQRTYRYFTGKPLYPFGYGLSYSKFEYGEPSVRPGKVKAGEDVVVSATIRNSGKVDGDEVAELYLSFPPFEGAPVRALRGFTRVRLKAGESKSVTFRLSPRDLSVVDTEGSRFLPEGEFHVSVGGGQPSTGAAIREVRFQVEGSLRLPE